MTAGVAAYSPVYPGFTIRRTTRSLGQAAQTAPVRNSLKRWPDRVKPFFQKAYDPSSAPSSRVIVLITSRRAATGLAVSSARCSLCSPSSHTGSSMAVKIT